MGIADLTAACAVVLPIGFFGAFYQAGVGDKVLDPGKSAYVFYLIEDGQGADSSYPVDGLEKGIGNRIVVIGQFQDGPFQIGKDAYHRY